MEQEEKKEKEKVYLSGLRLYLIIVLLLLLIFLFAGLSTGWFSQNKEVTATGMSVRAEGLHLGEVTITDVAYTRKTLVKGAENGETVTHLPQPFDWAAADVLLPGDIITVTAEFTTLANGGKPIPAEFSVLTPMDSEKIDGELPVVKDGKAYFLSSQIQVNGFAVKKVTPSGKILVILEKPYDPSTGTRLSDYAMGGVDPVTETRKTVALGENWELTENSKYEMVLTLEFVNDPAIDQTLLRGNPDTTAPEKVVPSAFWRELSVNELIYTTKVGN